MVQKRIHKLRRRMSAHHLKALLITGRSNVFFLSGFSGSSGYLLITEKDALLFTDFRYLQQAQKQANNFEVVKAEGNSSFSQILSHLSKEGIFELAFEEAYVTVREYNHLHKAASRLELIPIYNWIEEIRALKDNEELEYIAKAAAIADSAWAEVLPLLQPGIAELEVAAELEYRLRRKGSSQTPFEIIVASGFRSALPHGVATSKLIKENELVTVDFGAVYRGYSSDITRTFVMGNPNTEQEKIFSLVLEGQRLAMENIKAGMDCTAADELVRSFFQENGYEQYFGHGLGHGVGINVHELPTLSPKGKGTLQNSMVFTLEPGIYIEGWGGVRLEDLVVLKDEGLQVLTKSSKALSI